MKQKIKHEIKQTPVEQLHMYARNARTHSGEQVKRIAESIQEFGFLNPILVDSASKEIIAGHGRLLAARELGLETVPVVFYNHLTDIQRRAYTLADNKLALDAGWDEELLKLELDELKLEDFDLGIIGFEGFDFNTINNDNDSEFKPNLPKEDNEDRKGIDYEQKFEMIITLQSESEQRELFEEMGSRGISCKIL